MLLLATTAQAQPCIYVSTFTGNQILCVDGSSGATSVVHTFPTSVRPRDMVVGPDGNLYIADANGPVWRLDPSQPQGPGNPVVISTLPPGAVPEAPSFSGSNNLYVNSEGSGVWKIPDAAAPNVVIPIVPVNVIGAFTTAGAGSAFGMPGNLLLVDRAQNRVLSANSPYSAASPLITAGPNAPVGIGVNACGNILVASGTAIQRYSASGQFLNDYVNFSTGENVQYLEFTSGNIAYAVTARDDSGDAGKVWRIAPVLGPSNEEISSCDTGSKTLLVSLVDALAQEAVPGLQTDKATGLAIPATEASLTRSFGAGPDQVCSTADDDLTQTSAVYTFFHNTYELKFKQLLRCFSATVTTLKSEPGSIIFTNPPFRSGTTGTRYSSWGGFNTEYRVEQPAPVAGVDYVSTNSKDAYQVKMNYFTDDTLISPGVAKGPSNGAYDTDISLYFWSSAGPGTDPADAGTVDDFSKFIAINEPLDPAKIGTFVLKEPALTGNPQFKMRQAIPVAFTVTGAGGKPVRDVIARLSIATVNPFRTQTVVSTNHQNANIFSTGGNLYLYIVDSSFLDAGLKSFTITSDAFPPQRFFVSVVP